jgi:5'-3' exonuclease
MGIDSLWTFLKKRAPGAFSELPLRSLAGSRVAIDMNFHVFRMFKRCGCDDDATVQELQLLFDCIRSLHIRAVFVFDGNTAGLKARAHAARALASEKAHARVAEFQDTLRAMEDATTAAEIAAVELVEARLAAAAAADTAAAATDTAAAATDTAAAADIAAADTAAADTDPAMDGFEGTDGTDGTDDVDIDSTFDTTSRPLPAEDVVTMAPTHAEMAAVRELLGKASKNATRPRAELMHRLWTAATGYGVVVRADDDGEKLVAQLCARGTVDYAVSGDGDTLAFGATQLIRHLDPRYNTVTVISLPVVIRSLRLLNMEGFVNLAILAGNDMHKLPGIGIVKALQLLNKFGTPEAALATAVEFRLHPPPPDFDVAAIRDRFTSLCLCGADIDVGPAAVPGPMVPVAPVAPVIYATSAAPAKPSILSMLLQSAPKKM